MKQFVLFIAKMTVAVSVFLSPVAVEAKEPLVILTDPWPPFSLQEEQTIKGLDVEIIEAVFAKLDIPIQLKIYPWKRCLAMVKEQKADAVLDLSVTPERKAFLSFPHEPVSEGVTVFFTKKEKQIPFSGLKDLTGLRAGALLGYRYCEEIDNAPFILSADRVKELKQNFKKLLAGRIDFLIAVDLVGHFTAKTMGISDQVHTIPNANYCRGGNYLAFAKKAESDQLATKFGQALRLFKTTKSHQMILQKYGIKTD